MNSIRIVRVDAGGRAGVVGGAGSISASHNLEITVSGL